MFNSTFDRAMFLVLTTGFGAVVAPAWWVGLLGGLAIGLVVVAWNPDMPRR